MLVPVGITGQSGGLLQSAIDFCLCIPSQETPLIQEVHIGLSISCVNSSKRNSLLKAIFLDRDGVLNRKAPEGAYVAELRQFELLPGSLDALVELYRHAYKLFVVTNQRGIATGALSPGAVERIHRYLLRKVEDAGARIEHVYVCPHDYVDRCGCRKPLPGMLLQAAQDFNIDLSGSWMIGDSASDIEAGRRAGCRTGFVGPGRCDAADLSAPSLKHLVTQLLSYR